MEKKKVFRFIAKVIVALLAGVLIFFIFEWVGVDHQTGRSILTNTKVLIKVIVLVAIVGSAGYQAFKKIIRKDETPQEFKHTQEDKELSLQNDAINPQASLAQEQIETQAEPSSKMSKRNIFAFSLIAIIAISILVLIGLLCRNNEQNDVEPMIFQEQTTSDSQLLNMLLNEQEKKIVGKWDNSYTDKHIAENENDVTSTISEERIVDFQGDKTEVETGTVAYTFVIDSESYIVLEYERFYKGIWHVEENTLIAKGTDYKMTFIRGYMHGGSTSHEEEYINQTKESLEVFFETVNRPYLFKQRDLKIITLTENRLMLEDEGGGLYEMKKIQ